MPYCRPFHFFYSRFAVFLGQINQLSVGGSLSARHSDVSQGPNVAHCPESHTQSNRLDNPRPRRPDAQRSICIQRRDFAYRLPFLCVVVLPLLLSVGYIKSVGGEGTILVNRGNRFFGYSFTLGKAQDCSDSRLTFPLVLDWPRVGSLGWGDLSWPTTVNATVSEMASCTRSLYVI